jgi:transporter family protein
MSQKRDMGHSSFMAIGAGNWAISINRMNWIGWALLSALFAAATALLAKVGVAHVDSNLATALRTSVVVVFAWGIALTWARPAGGGGLWAEVRGLDARTVAFLALSGLATGLSWICYFRALQMGPASRVAPLDKLSVPLVMVFAWLLLGERMNAAAVAGGLLITAGAVVMALA